MYLLTLAVSNACLFLEILHWDILPHLIQKSLGENFHPRIHLILTKRNISPRVYFTGISSPATALLVVAQIKGLVGTKMLVEVHANIRQKAPGGKEMQDREQPRFWSLCFPTDCDWSTLRFVSLLYTLNYKRVCYHWSHFEQKHCS